MMMKMLRQLRWFPDERCASRVVGGLTRWKRLSFFVTSSNRPKAHVGEGGKSGYKSFFFYIVVVVGKFGAYRDGAWSGLSFWGWCWWWENVHHRREGGKLWRLVRWFDWVVVLSGLHVRWRFDGLLTIFCEEICSRLHRKKMESWLMLAIIELFSNRLSIWEKFKGNCRRLLSRYTIRQTLWISTNY